MRLSETGGVFPTNVRSDLGTGSLVAGGTDIGSSRFDRLSARDTVLSGTERPPFLGVYRLSTLNGGPTPASTPTHTSGPSPVPSVVYEDSGLRPRVHYPPIQRRNVDSWFSGDHS